MTTGSFSVKLPQSFHAALQAAAQRRQQSIRERDGVLVVVSPTMLVQSAVERWLWADDPAWFARHAVHQEAAETPPEADSSAEIAVDAAAPSE